MSLSYPYRVPGHLADYRTETLLWSAVLPVCTTGRGEVDMGVAYPEKSTDNVGRVAIRRITVRSTEYNGPLMGARPLDMATPTGRGCLIWTTPDQIAAALAGHIVRLAHTGQAARSRGTPEGERDSNSKITEPSDPMKIMTAAPNMVRRGDAYVFTWPGIHVQVELDYFYETRGDLYAELLIGDTLADPPTLIHSSRLNLNASGTRASLVKELKLSDPSLPWGTMLEEVCFLAKRSAAASLAFSCDFEVVDTERWLLEPYIEAGRAACR